MEDLQMPGAEMMTIDEARLFLQELEPINPCLMRALSLVQQAEDQEEFERVRRAIGQLIAKKYNELERPIYEDFPELEPAALQTKP